MSSPLRAYDEMVGAGQLQPDPAQRHAAEALERLVAALRRYRPGDKGGLLRKAAPAPRGLYLWGGVGTGKSLLMDLFFENAGVARARRVHFHAFMQETHRFLAFWRAAPEAVRKAHPARLRSAALDDPIPHAANAIFAEAALLCFDEVQVTDITDAMLLGRLFDNLFALGAVMVATSNRPPDDLYKDGINRQLFLPFIARLKDRLEVLEVKSARDYRLDRLRGEPVYFSPLGPDARDGMDRAFAAMTAGATATTGAMPIGSRALTIPQMARGVGRGPFAHWCGSALGPQDYLALAAAFPVFFIDDIPRLGPAERNEARRFVTLIDALYEARTVLFCSAAAAPAHLYPAGDGAFEFARTASRLEEMQSMDYLSLSHEARGGAAD
jgi:cell division protein ZapE